MVKKKPLMEDTPLGNAPLTLLFRMDQTPLRGEAPLPGEQPLRAPALRAPAAHLDGVGQRQEAQTAQVQVQGAEHRPDQVVSRRGSRRPQREGRVGGAVGLAGRRPPGVLAGVRGVHGFQRRRLLARFPLRGGRPGPLILAGPAPPAKYNDKLQPEPSAPRPPSPLTARPLRGCGAEKGCGPASQNRRPAIPFARALSLPPTRPREPTVQSC